MKGKKLYDFDGMALLSLPAGKRNGRNTNRRNIEDLKQMTAAHLLKITGLRADAPLLFCGSHSKAFPLLSQLTKMSDMPFLMIGSQSDFETSCLRDMDVAWEAHGTSEMVRDGNGLLIVSPDAETVLELKEYITGLDTHLIIMCLGSGLYLDSEFLNILNSLSRYVLVSQALSRSVKMSRENGLTTEDLLSCMDYMIVSSIGISAKALLSVLPSFECEKITNTTDVSAHKDSPVMFESGHHHRNGGGLRLSQSKTQETKTILTEDDLTSLQEQNRLLIYNAQKRKTFVAKVVR